MFAALTALDYAYYHKRKRCAVELCVAASAIGLSPNDVLRRYKNFADALSWLEHLLLVPVSSEKDSISTTSSAQSTQSGFAVESPRAVYQWDSTMIKVGDSSVELGSVIGRGVYSVVYSGILTSRVDGMLSVAVKMLPSGSSDAQQKLFSREIRKLQVISQRCSGMCETYGSYSHEGQMCLVMKLYERNLVDDMALGKRELIDILDLSYQIASSLVSLHTHVRLSTASHT